MLIHQQGAQGVQGFDFYHHPRPQIHHEHGGHHDLVGRDGDEISQQDNAVQAHEVPQGVEEVGDMLGQGRAA